MNQRNYQELELDQIVPSPFNPRKSFKGPRFDELIASIKSVGVLEPILVRPKRSDGADFEIVAGERRFRAKKHIAESNGGLAGAVIPAIIQEMDDATALDIQTIENLQRENLTELEEAEAFKMFVGKKGEGAVSELAERTGIREAYIRRRLALFTLPKKVLTAWDKGKLKYGHLEQLIRLKDKKEILSYFEQLTDEKAYGSPMTVDALRHQISTQSPELKGARFDLKKEGCPACSHNSDVQKKLFSIDVEKGKCLNRKCFKQKQNDHILKHWKKSGPYKAYGVRAFRFREDFSYNDYNNFWNGAPKKCKACDSFVALLTLYGKPDYEEVCIGDRDCYDKASRSKQKSSTTKASTDDGTGPRVSWHGDYFREQFFKDALPERIKTFKPDDERIFSLVLYAFIQSIPELHQWFAVKHNIKADDIDSDCSWFRLDYKDLFGVISMMKTEQIFEDLHEALSQVVLMHTFTTNERWLMAGYLDLHLQDEWSITQEYLAKKTKAEILEFGEQLNLFTDPKIETFLFEVLLKKRGSFKSCKKSELIRLLMESGVDLRGKVPEEVLSGHPLHQSEESGRGFRAV
ncbi:MAG: ParB/RepB/Spo0J family partition protein [Desulfobacteraceae bacterium]|nr:ParB/RepB/Spo0J family partition protein [Desulfobacteraceae bacterium]